MADQDSSLPNDVSPSVRLREMDIDDLSLVFHLGEKLFQPDDYPSLYRTWDQHEITELFNSDTEFCLVAEVDGVFAGFALGTTIEKDRSAWKYGHLIWLGVEPAYQGAGVGEKLFRRFRELMRKDGVRMLLVDTATANEQALRFFQKMGFGNPRRHVYLTLNLANRQSKPKRRVAQRVAEAEEADETGGRNEG